MTLWVLTFGSKTLTTSGNGSLGPFLPKGSKSLMMRTCGKKRRPQRCLRAMATQTHVLAYSCLHLCSGPIMDQSLHSKRLLPPQMGQRFNFGKQQQTRVFKRHCIHYRTVAKHKQIHSIVTSVPESPRGWTLRPKMV